MAWARAQTKRKEWLIDHYFEEKGVELTDLYAMSLLVTYVTHRLPQATCHWPRHFALVSLQTHLFPLSFGTPAASAHANPLQHHLYPLLKGWGQLCLSSLQGPPLGTEMPEWGESPVPSVPQSPHPCHQASPCQIWHPMLHPPPQQGAVSLSRPCFPECSEAGFCGQGQGCWCPLQPHQAPPHGQDGLVAAAGPQVWFFECGELPQGWSLNQAELPGLNEVS